MDHPTAGCTEEDSDDDQAYTDVKSEFASLSVVSPQEEGEEDGDILVGRDHLKAMKMVLPLEVATVPQDQLKHYEFNLTFDWTTNTWKPSHADTRPPTPSMSEFPNALGPFRVLVTQLVPQIIHMQHGQCGLYAVNLEGDVASLRVNDEEQYGSLSPPHRLTLTVDNKRKAHIPDAAASFVWAYPLAGIGEMKDKRRTQLATKNSSMCLLLFGGYLYFDANGTFLQANAIAPGAGLYFSSPQEWRHEFTNVLSRDGRFQEITIASMKDQGAVYYCWLLPGEVLKTSLGHTWNVPGQGAFVYLFHKDFSAQDPRDCFFYIEDSTQIPEHRLNPAPPAETTFSFVRELPRQSKSDRSSTGSQSMAALAEMAYCVVCLEKQREILLGCGHLCMCEECASDPKIVDCPMCRKPVTNKLKAIF